MLRTVLLLLCVYQVDLICKIDHRSKEIMWEGSLRKYLLCNYHELEQPNNVTDVEMSFILKSFSFDSREEKFTMHSWMFVSWYDLRLKWNPYRYEEIDLLYLDQSEIWTPVLQYHDPILTEEADIEYYYNSKCQIHNYGKVLCATGFSTTVLCNTMLRNWPYDTQSCKFKFGTNTDKVKLFYRGVHGISMIEAEYGVGWDIIDYKQEESNSSGGYLSMTFLLERHADGIVAINIFPSISIAILTLSTIFLKIDNTRISMLCFSLYLHYTVLITIVDLPHHGVDAPSLLYFIRGSMFITFLLLALTFISRKLQSNVHSPPCWIVTIDDYVLKSYLRYAIWPKWNAESGTKLTENELDSLNKWNNFTNITNSVCIIVMPLAYIIMYMLFMPRPTLSIVSFDVDEN